MSRMALISSSKTILTEESWLVIILNLFKCYATEAPSFILRLYSLFIKKTLFDDVFFSYKSCNFFHRPSVVFSPATLKYTFFAEYYRAIAIAFLSSLFQSSTIINEGFFATPSIGKYWSFKINMSSICDFHRAKLAPFNFSMSLTIVASMLLNEIELTPTSPWTWCSPTFGSDTNC